MRDPAPKLLKFVAIAWAIFAFAMTPAAAAALHETSLAALAR